MDIILKNLNKSYNGIKVLENLSAVFFDKKINYVMGESGVGKTTLLNIIMGIELPDSGEVEGIINRKISAVFQEDRLCEDFNSITNIRLVCNLDKEFIAKELGKVGLWEHLNKPVSKLSGGMRRRVAIVRAMLADSDIIVLDEPLKGLDDETKKHVIEYIKEKINNKLIIMITHDKDETLSIDGEIFNM